MTNPTQETLIYQRLDAQENRTDDLATAFAKLRVELDATTDRVHDLLLWVVHRPIEPESKSIKSHIPFES